VRTLGKSDIELFAIGLDGMGMSQNYGARDHAESTKTLNRTLDIAIDFLDTDAR